MVGSIIKIHKYEDKNYNENDVWPGLLLYELNYWYFSHIFWGRTSSKDRRDMGLSTH